MDPLESYARKELEKGFSKKEIYAKLISSGYKAERIQPLLDSLHESASKKPMPWIAMVIVILLIIGVSTAVLWFMDTEDTVPSSQTALLPEDYSFDSETGMIHVKEKYSAEP